jgi:capsular polysaccharide biosynthesis protein
MSNAEVSSLWYSTHLRDILRCIRKDIVLILLATIVLTAIGAITGKMTNKTTSTAQLVLTPIPLRAKAAEDPFAVMLAAPLDVTSMSLLCESDEVLQKTMDDLNESGQLSKPIKYITSLKNKLSYGVTVAKETPYELVYTPVLQLSAKAATAADAKLMANTWAKAVTEAATKFQDAVQKPAEQALNERVATLSEELQAAEQDNEKFWAENNMDYYAKRIDEIIMLINSFKKSRTELERGMIADRAMIESFNEAVALEKPTIELRWRPSKELVDSLGGKLGVNLPKAETGEQDLLTVEHTNVMYWEIRGKLAATRAGLASKQAELQEVDRLIGELEKERLEVQAKHARALTEKGRIVRTLKRVEDTYSNIAGKHEFAQVAGQLKHPVLQVISKGTEWPLPRFRRLVLFGVVSAVLGFCAAMTCSVVMRMIVRPALEG